jgi:hypothetical protein
LEHETASRLIQEHIGIRYVDGFTAPTFADLLENAPFAE